jgi:hypothetical protein
MTNWTVTHVAGSYDLDLSPATSMDNLSTLEITLRAAA